MEKLYVIDLDMWHIRRMSNRGSCIQDEDVTIVSDNIGKWLERVQIIDLPVMEQQWAKNPLLCLFGPLNSIVDEVYDDRKNQDDSNEGPDDGVHCAKLS